MNWKGERKCKKVEGPTQERAQGIVAIKVESVTLIESLGFCLPHILFVCWPFAGISVSQSFLNTSSMKSWVCFCFSPSFQTSLEVSPSWVLSKAVRDGEQLTCERLSSHDTEAKGKDLGDGDPKWVTGMEALMKPAG